MLISRTASSMRPLRMSPLIFEHVPTSVNRLRTTSSFLGAQNRFCGSRFHHILSIQTVFVSIKYVTNFLSEMGVRTFHKKGVVDSVSSEGVRIARCEALVPLLNCLCTLLRNIERVVCNIERVSLLHRYAPIHGFTPFFVRNHQAGFRMCMFFSSTDFVGRHRLKT